MHPSFGDEGLHAVGDGLSIQAVVRPLPLVQDPQHAGLVGDATEGLVVVQQVWSGLALQVLQIDQLKCGVCTQSDASVLTMQRRLVGDGR